MDQVTISDAYNLDRQLAKVLMEFFVSHQNLQQMSLQMQERFLGLTLMD